MSVEDVDKVMTDGMGMRYAFIGPFETCHLNAEGKLSAVSESDYNSQNLCHVNEVDELSLRKRHKIFICQACKSTIYITKL